MRTVEQFLSNVEHVDGCWLWRAGTSGATGYGALFWQDRKDYAHRVSYTIFRGEIPAGLQIDHLCRVRLCVNPHHLEAVTQAENLRRGSQSYALTGKCRSGRHDMRTEEDWYWVRRNGRRVGRTCRACHNENARRRRLKRALDVDRYEAGPAERDWDALGVAVAQEVCS